MLLVRHNPDAAITMSPATTVQCDALGRCSVHPFVQIRRKSTRTGQWKELLESCPLCAMDGRGGGSSVSGGSSVCSAASSSSRGGHAASTGGIDRSDRSSGYGSSSSDEGDGLDGSRRSRVSFHDGMEDEADDIRRNIAALRSLPYHGSDRGDDRSPSGSLSGLAGLPDASGSGRGVVDLSASGGGGGGSVVSTGARSALKRPKYKVCKSLMRRQLDDSNRVPKMSEDLDIDVESDDEDGHDKDAMVPRPVLEDSHEDIHGGIQGGREEEKEREIELEEDEDDEPPAERHETRRAGSGSGGQARSGGSVHGQGGRERRPPPRQSASFNGAPAPAPAQGQQRRPASFHGDDRGALRQQRQHQQQQQRFEDRRGSAGSSHSSSSSSTSRQKSSSRSARSRRESKRQQQRSASCHAGIRTPSAPEPAESAASRPDPEEFPCGQSRSSRDSSRAGGQSRGGGGGGSRQLAVVSPSGDVTARGGAGGAARGSSVPPPPRPEYNMVIRAPANFKDDVSAISFMGSVSTPPPPPPAGGGGQRMSHIGEEDESLDGECGGVGGDDDADRIDTNEYDRKGRCVRHPHVRLRKKKLFGRGWKVLMSACPDCCVDELKRIRLVEEGKRKASKRPSAPRAAAAPQQQAAEQQQQPQPQPRQVPPSQPGQGPRRSFHRDEPQEPRQGRQGSGGSFHGDGPADQQPPSSRRPSQRTGEPSRRRRSASTQRQNSLSSNQSSLPSQQQHPPPPKRSSSVTPGVSRSLVLTSAGSDVDTASLTEPSSDSSNEADGSKSRPPAGRRGQQQPPRPSSFHGGPVPSAREQGRKTMYVRKMMHTDRATGRTGRYTGRVDESFVPDGEGALTHDDGSVLEGEWRDGRLVSSGPVARRQPSSGGGGGGGGQRSRSGSRTRGGPREPSRDRHGSAHGARASGRSRSHSRTAGGRERSTSRSSAAGRHHHQLPVQGYGQ
mmetsp:Transcript_11428/g.24737  ORF Transcript_11428/g.24737 Transcript_11428/m.24737 type:complete len:954 (+) Transcript_11428:310-3171(+)